MTELIEVLTQDYTASRPITGASRQGKKAEMVLTPDAGLSSFARPEFPGLPSSVDKPGGRTPLSSGDTHARLA